MALSLQLGYPDIPKSITNPNVRRQDALDSGNPFSFLQFIKIIIVSFEPDTLKEYYNFYLTKWNNVSIEKQNDNDAFIIERYKEFLREIGINYTTLEEKKFLSKIDFDDVYDLDIAISFFSKKINEIISYYNNKRHNIQFNLSKSKLKGSNYGTEKTLTEVTLNYLRGLDDGRIVYDYDAIKSQMEIEIEELYDTYPLYFNQTPDPNIYDNKDLDYGFNLFLKTNSDVLKDELSSISSELSELKELDSLLDNKRKLSQSLVFTDFYYLSTGSTVNQFISGKLFTSEHNIENFLNRSYPTTASTERTDYLKSSREKGFFKPTNTSIILIDGLTKSFSINFDGLSPNSLYYFPDPKIFADNNVITYIVDDQFLKRNASSGNAVNQPTSSPLDTKYYGYVSQNDPNIQKNLDVIFDSGYIKDAKKDIYGNLFGLLDNSSASDAFKSNNIISLDSEETNKYSYLINGYEFYDVLYNEGYSFNYNTVDALSTYYEIYRTGLTLNTEDFTEFNPELTLFFGKFTPYVELYPPTEDVLLTTYQINDGAFISKSNFEPYPETYSSDLSAFSTEPGTYYYSQLIEGGISESSPLTRALLDPLYPSLTANLTEFLKTSAVAVHDGGYILSNYNFDITIQTEAYDYLNQTDQYTEFYTLSDLPASFYGKILVKNRSTNKVDTLLNTLTYFNTRYSQPILDELESNVTHFEISNDTLIIQTPNYFIIDRIKFENHDFVSPSVDPIEIQYNKNWANKLSNRFKVGNYVYYSILNTISTTISSQAIRIYPEIYRYDILNYQNALVYDGSSSFFTLTSVNSFYYKLEPPTLAYNSRNDIFKLSFLAKDINNIPTLYEFDFDQSPTVNFISEKIYNFNQNGSTIIYDVVPSSYSFFLSSSLPIIAQNYELIL